MTIPTSPLSHDDTALYVETRGSGPLLLLIPGGPQDAGVFDGLAEALADRFTVLTYDPRGNSRSPFGGDPSDLDLDLHGDDAAGLIDAVGSGPAFVFGTSGGAQIGLNLAARHPDRVAVLVAHEPPCVLLLDDPTDALAADEAVYAAYRAGGVDAAFATFLEVSGMAGDEDGPPEPPSDAEAATFGRMEGNMDAFFAHGMRSLSEYVPDVAALRAGAPRVVVGLGEQSGGTLTGAASRALADRLGVAPVLFPGDHVAYTYAAEPFATRLAAVLS